MNFDFIDLTHTLHSDIPHWDLECGFSLACVQDYAQNSEDISFKLQKITLQSGTGTHIDAPSHCFKNGINADQIALNQLIVPCVVIDVAHKVHDATYIVSVDDIAEFESKYNPCFNNSLTIIHTGWSQYWQQPNKYRNNLQFPSISMQAAQYLIDKGIAGLGIDTLSPDTASSIFAVHKIVLGANKYIIENVANSHKMPPCNAHAIILPMKIQNSTEAPIRLIGCVPK